MWDLGSSSFQVLVCDIGPHQSLTPVLKRRSLLNLGLDVGIKGTISPERAIASVAAAKRLRRALGPVNPQVVVALATAALRDATNGPEVVARLEKAVGTPICTLDGKQEARLCFAGQRAGVYVGEGPTLGIDLGGGSFELAIGDRFEIYSVASAPIGATRLQGELGVGQVLSRDDRKEVRERVREAFEAMDLRLDEYPGAASRVVLSGGTARALARLAMARTRGGAGAAAWGVNQVELARGQVAELAAMLAHLDLRQRRPCRECRPEGPGVACGGLHPPGHRRRTGYRLLRSERMGTS